MFRECKDCEKRTLGCHGGCDKYKESKQKSEQVRIAKAEFNRSRYEYIDYRADVFKNRR